MEEFVRIFPLGLQTKKPKAMKEIRKEYTDGKINVIWQPGKCMHAARCITGLPQVFRPAERPWIKMDAATSDEIKKVVEQCPSGALTWEPT